MQRLIRKGEQDSNLSNVYKMAEVVQLPKIHKENQWEKMLRAMPL